MTHHPQVSTAALIREMDAEELKSYLAELAEVSPHHTGADILQQVKLVQRQYRQLTGEVMTINLPGMTISMAAMLAAVEC